MKFWTQNATQTETSRQALPQGPAQLTETTPGKGRILLVEDNPRVLAATERFLCDNGYAVTTAGTLTEALEHLSADPDINLLITDYHLSAEETGTQLIHAARQARGPTFKIVVITGDTFAAVHAFDGDNCLWWLRKPFNSGQLTSVLNHLLARHAD